MLRFVAEMLILVFNDDGDITISVPDRTLRYALAGAVLLDLTL